MELLSDKMGARQKTYRATYRDRVAGWYNGWLHVVIIYAIGFGVMYICLANLRDVAWWEWGVLPVTFLGANFFEWWIHRYVMHRPSRVKALKAIYTRHTLMHHQFFTEEEMRFADHTDWRVTFFPPYALVTFTALSLPGAVLLSLLVSANCGWLFVLTTTAMYLIYEFMHFCCHVDDNAFVRNMPLVNTIRRHHAAHHNQSLMMERNMNLTFPIMDWLFGTSDLDRGLLGHLFNGYDTHHIKQRMRRTQRTPMSGTPVPPAAPADIGVG